MSNYARFFRPNLPQHIDCLVEVEKLAWSSPGENIEACREKLALRAVSYPGHQSVVLAMVGDEPAGSQYAFQFNWDQNIAALSSWDEYTASGWTNKVHNSLGNTGFLVGVGVVPKFRGLKVTHNLRWLGKYKISELLIAKTLDNLFRRCVKQVIANARIPFYHMQSHLSVHEYCALRRDDGKLFDPVLRFHERMGAKIIKPIEYSMKDAESLNGGCWVVYQHRFGGV
jgi:hypothetical protein